MSGACPPFEELSALHDNDLSPRRARGVRTHVAACARCQAELDGLESLLEQARGLERPAPPPALWDEIARALDRREASLLRWRPYLVGAFAGAAAVMVVGGVALGWRQPGPGAEPVSMARGNSEGLTEDPLVAEAEAELEQAARQWEASIRKLHALVEARQGEWLAPARARHVERLARLDQEIVRLRAALRRTPGDAAGGDVLFAAYRNKVTYLAEVVHRGAPLAVTGAP